MLALAAAVPGPLVCAAACGSPSSAATAATPLRLYAYPASTLFAAAALLKINGHKKEAAELKAIARTPSGVWATGQPGEMQQVRQVTQAATQTHAIPVIVAYNLPARDACGKFSAASGPTAVQYKNWVGQLAAAIGTGDDIVIVEPDGLPDIVRGCLSEAHGSQRYQLLPYAIQHLAARPAGRAEQGPPAPRPSRPRVRAAHGGIPRRGPGRGGCPFPAWAPARGGSAIAPQRLPSQPTLTPPPP